MVETQKSYSNWVYIKYISLLGEAMITGIFLTWSLNKQ